MALTNQHTRSVPITAFPPNNHLTGHYDTLFSILKQNSV